MVDHGLEGDLGWLERVLGRELNIDQEGTLKSENKITANIVITYLVVWSLVRHQQPLPEQDVTLVHLESKGFTKKLAKLISYLNIPESLVRWVFQVGQLLLQPSGSSHGEKVYLKFIN